MNPMASMLLLACVGAVVAGSVFVPLSTASEAGTPHLVQSTPSGRMRSVIEQMDAGRIWAVLDSYPKVSDWPHWVGDEPQTESYTRWPAEFRSDQPLYVVALRKTGLVVVRRGHGMDGRVEYFLVPIAPALSSAKKLDLPDPGVGRTKDSRAEKQSFVRGRAEHHRWKRGMPFPTELGNLGLKPDAILVCNDAYFDGGTRGFLLRDSEGKYLALATGPGLQTKDLPGRIDAEINSLIFIGALHYLDPEAEMVPPNSASEAFLVELLNTAASSTSARRE